MQLKFVLFMIKYKIKRKIVNCEKIGSICNIQIGTNDIITIRNPLKFFDDIAVKLQTTKAFSKNYSLSR